VSLYCKMHHFKTCNAQEFTTTTTATTTIHAANSPPHTCNKLPVANSHIPGIR
jgi:hypothetical protein